MKKSAYIIVLAAAVMAGYLGYLFILFTGEVQARGRHGLKDADAIVVLTGGRHRVEEGLGLLRQGRSRLLILSGVDEGAGLESIFLGRLRPDEKKGIVLEKRSRSTFENAVEVKRLAEERGLRSIILITSAYHMKRAGYIFSRVLPKSIEITPYSVSSPNFDEERRLASKNLDLLALEFFKYLWYEVRFGVDGRGED